MLVQNAVSVLGTMYSMNYNDMKYIGFS